MRKASSLVPLCLLILAGLVAPLPAAAQNAWLPTSWFTRDRIDPQAMFPLAEKDGPWLVLATTFRGEAARDDARALVQELRRDFGLQAYTHEKQFDFTDRPQGLGLNPDGSPKKMRYANATKILEVAVLVGDFASSDDSRGQKTLTKVKRLQPQCLAAGKVTSRSYADFRRLVGLDKQADKGPLHLAFMIPNPLLPADYFARPEVEAFVVEMNSDVEHSLLDCPGRYTVRVATFTGGGTFDQKAIESGKSDAFENRLVEAAEKAHRLTVLLRKQGWQAWEFHDRDQSIVCVGSLSQLTVPGPDGQPAVHPEITRIGAGLGPDPEKLAVGTILPKSFGGIMLDAQLQPVDVPRVSARIR
jgi:hypothetical protein